MGNREINNSSKITVGVLGLQKQGFWLDGEGGSAPAGSAARGVWRQSDSGSGKKDVLSRERQEERLEGCCHVSGDSHNGKNLLRQFSMSQIMIRYLVGQPGAFKEL